MNDKRFDKLASDDEIRQDNDNAASSVHRIAAEVAIGRGNLSEAYLHIEKLKEVSGETDQVVWLLAMCAARQSGASAALRLVCSNIVASEHSTAVTQMLKQQGDDLLEARKLVVEQSELIGALARGVGRLQDINDSLGESLRVLRAVDRSSELYKASEFGFSAAPSSARQLNVLYVSGDPGSPSHEYRVQNYVDALAAVGVSAEFVPFGEFQKLHDAIHRASIVVFWRCPLRADLTPALHLCKLRRTPIVFDVDDYVFEPRIAVTKYIDGIRFLAPGVTEQYYWGIKAYRRLLLASDATTITTQYLADQVEQIGRIAHVLPNGLDKTYVSVAEGKVIAGKSRKAASADVVIGYTPGSKTHQRDFAECADALAEVLIERPHVRLLIVGLLDLDEFPLFAKVESQIDVDPTLGRTHLRERLSEMDIHIAPVELGNPFTESKSELKYFEPAALGIPTIASATQPFQSAIEHGVTGYLARTRDEWKDALHRLVNDVEHRTDIGIAARSHTLRTYALRPIGLRAKDTYQEIIYRHRCGYGFSADALTIRIMLDGIEPIRHRDQPVIALARGMADLGHHVELVFLNAPTVSVLQLRADYDLPPSVAISTDTDGFKPVDVLLATSVATCRRAKDLWLKAAIVCSIVQDHQAVLRDMDSGTSSTSKGSEPEVGRVALGEWTAQRLANAERTSPLISLPSFYDHRIFVPLEGQRPHAHKHRIVVIAGNILFDRLVAQCIERIPQRSLRTIEFDILGDWSGGAVHASHSLHGIPSPLSRAAIFQRATLGIALSSSAPSQFTFEMMACGLPVIGAQADEVEVIEKYRSSRNLVLAAPTPGGVVAEIEALLRNSKRRAEIAGGALEFVKKLPDEHQIADQLNRYFRELLLDNT